MGSAHDVESDAHVRHPAGQHALHDHELEREVECGGGNLSRPRNHTNCRLDGRDTATVRRVA